MIEEKEKTNANLQKIEEEIGDLMFSVINLARHLDVNPEIALDNANNKFMNRFNLMLQEFDNNKKFTKASDKKKENAWKKIKKL